MRVWALGLAGGIMWGVSMLVTTLISVYTGYATLFLQVMASIYPGFDISVGGAFLGLAYGFVDAFVGLIILGWLYRLFACCGSCRHKC